ncbi:MAG: ATP-binding cassette domain-containing protein [Ignavibacteria bacterium]|nr:ATP-binding cassette domain-containing protein [Ignavibacteria bacterium]
MSEYAVRVNDVSKAFLIGLKETRKETLGAELISWFRSPRKNYNTLKRLNTFDHIEESEDLFWALRNISSDLKQGETLGIIGDNGAGKSTILKIISRITNPTIGYAEVYGRSASLLEVGTGFNSELTGRENVYLNGTILGMTKKEIDSKFDTIVDFSGVEKFIDTQVKKYSSGMRIRLAFAVAANIETEVMIIDEVLSIGDADFRKKSLEKMIEISRGGTAILLATHNFLPIQAMCKNTIHLDHGRIVNYGNTNDVVSKYLGDMSKDMTRQSWSIDDAPSSDSIKITKAEVVPVTNLPVIRAGDPFEFRFEFYNMLNTDYDINIMFHLIDDYDNLIFIGSTVLTNLKFRATKGYIQTSCRIPENLLNHGKFTISKLYVLQGFEKVLYEHTNLLVFEITGDVEYEKGKSGKIDGIMKPKLSWEVNSKKEI